MRLSHVLPGSWTDLVGVQVGDFVTHVDGQAVSEMLSPQEFLTAVARRPCAISFLLQVDDADVRAVARPKSSATDRISDFDRLFGVASPDCLPGLASASALFAGSAPVLAISSSDSEAEVIEVGADLAALPAFGIAASPAPRALPKRRAAALPARALPLHALHPRRLHVFVGSGVHVPRSSGIAGSDPLWQPLSSEPFVELFLRRQNTGHIVSRRLQTQVDAQCAWNHKFVLPLPLAEADSPDSSSLVLVLQLLDYRRFTEHLVMGVAEIPLAEIPLQAGVGPETEIGLKSTLAYFDVSQTRLRLRVHIPASALPDQPAQEVEEVEEEGAAGVPPAAEKEAALESRSLVVRTERGVQTTDGDTWIPTERNTHGSIPWFYVKWHEALTHRRQ